MAKQPINRLKPNHLVVIRLHWFGRTNDDIAQSTGLSVEQVRNILKFPETREVLDELQHSTLDCMQEVAQELQLISPLAVKRLGDLMISGDERVALVAAKEVLHMAGHAPVKRVHIAQATRVEKEYDGLPEHEIRQKLLEDLTGETIGPDGRPLN